LDEESARRGGGYGGDLTLNVQNAEECRILTAQSHYINSVLSAAQI